MSRCNAVPTGLGLTVIDSDLPTEGHRHVAPCRGGHWHSVFAPHCRCCPSSSGRIRPKLMGWSPLSVSGTWRFPLWQSDAVDPVRNRVNGTAVFDVLSTEYRR
jgi:hypothetical protein